MSRLLPSETVNRYKQFNMIPRESQMEPDTYLYEGRRVMKCCPIGIYCHSIGRSCPDYPNNVNPKDLPSDENRIYSLPGFADSYLAGFWVEFDSVGHRVSDLSNPLYREGVDDARLTKELLDTEYPGWR